MLHHLFRRKILKQLVEPPGKQPNPFVETAIVPCANMRNFRTELSDHCSNIENHKLLYFNAWELVDDKTALHADPCLPAAAYFLPPSFSARKRSSAVIMLGDSGSGALMCRLRPASSMALRVLLPNPPIKVPFC